VRRLAPVAAAAMWLAACGTRPADLFEVERTGRDRNANVRMLVSDGGSVRCNDQESRAIDGPTLLEARDIARQLAQTAELAIELPPGDDPTLRYSVRTEAGTVAFTDRSEGRPMVFDRVVAFTARVSEDVCGLQR
jgi:hypothetical protein